MKKETNGTIDTRVSRFLSQYRTTPHSTTGIAPAEMSRFEQQGATEAASTKVTS